MRKFKLYKLILGFSKIYFSRTFNKNIEYKKLLYKTFRDLGGVYVKFLQMLSVSHSFMNGWGTPREYEIFNKVEEEFIDLKRYLPHQEMYSFIEPKPFAAGSFAQVYHARLNSGQRVVIKILRPSVYNNLKKDLKVIRRILNLAQHFIPNIFLDIKKAFEEFSKNCILETDYKNEIANTEYFYSYYQDNENIVIPKIYKELCNDYLIVQEYIDGIPLANLISDMNGQKSISESVKELIGSDFWKQIIIVGGEALKTAITAEFTYGDPHPGNIILLPNDKVALIDFGLVAIKPVSQEAFYLWVQSYSNVLSGNTNYTSLLKSSCMCFCPDLINAFNKYFGTSNFINEISNILNDEALSLIKNNDEANKNANDGHIMTLFWSTLSSIKSLNIKIDMNNYQLLKAMQAFICTITTIDKNEEKSNYSYILQSSINYALDYCRQRGVKHDFIIYTKYNKEESYEMLLDFITSVANYDEYLFEKINERMFT